MSGAIAVIQARVSSMRLPGKILMELDRRPLLEHTIEGVKKAKKIDSVVVATSDKGSDDPVEELCRKVGVRCFRGSEHDVLARTIDAVGPKEPDLVVRICGDQPLIDPEIIDRAVEMHQGYDLSTTIDMVPKGMDAEVIDYNALLESGRKSVKQSHREHVTKYILDNPGSFRIQKLDFDKKMRRPDIVLTVDTRDDLDFVRAVYDAIKEEGVTAWNVISAVDSGRASRKPGLLVRADASKEIGFGDLTTCMRIADKLRERFEIIFAAKDDDMAVDFIKKSGYGVFPLAGSWSKDAEISRIKDFCRQNRISHCMVQKSPIDTVYVRELSGFLKVLEINLAGEKIVDADIFVNWNIDSDKAGYDVQGRDTLQLLGPDYVPLSDDLRLSNKDIHNESIQRITITLGGSDPNNICRKLADALKDIDKEITLILGPGYDGDIPNEKNIRVRKTPKDLYSIFRDSDLVLSNGGSTTFELCSIGVPFIGISKIPWEKERLEQMGALGICRHLDADGDLKKDLVSAIDELEDKAKRIDMARKGKRLVDGQGSVRIAQAIFGRWLDDEDRKQKDRKG
jgi:spore coat polysaccharide biosynthesis protein SpsF